MHHIGIWQGVSLSIELTNIIFMVAMHTDEQTASAEHIITLFIYIIPWKIIYLVYDELPPT